MKTDWTNKHGAIFKVSKEAIAKLLGLPDADLMVCEARVENGLLSVKVWHDSLPLIAEGEVYPSIDAPPDLALWAELMKSAGDKYEPGDIVHFRRKVDWAVPRGIPDFSFDAYQTAGTKPPPLPPEPDEPKPLPRGGYF